MGLSRGKRASTGLTDEQIFEVKHNLELVKLREKRERCKKINDRGYYPIETAKGTHLHTRYKRFERKVNNMAKYIAEKTTRASHSGLSLFNRYNRDRQAAGRNH